MTQQTPGGNAIAVTFVLAFEPSQTRQPAAVDALVRAGPQLVTECAGLFDHWHASRHFALGLHSELWFRFRSSGASAQALVAKALARLNIMSGTYGFVLKDPVPIIEAEARAFGEGDLRQGYDIVALIGGSHNLPTLWAEIQQATEWAIADLQSGTIRCSLPPTWEDWSRHIYRNLLGLE